MLMSNTPKKSTDTQIGSQRQYGNLDEDTSPLQVACPICQVKGIPRGIASTRAYSSVAGVAVKGEKHCLNCGHITGRDINKVRSIVVTGAGGATTITVDNGTLQMSAVVGPIMATDKTVIWSVINGTGNATISAGGLLTAGVGASNGTVTVVATANDFRGVTGSLVVTLSNQA